MKLIKFYTLVVFCMLSIPGIQAQNSSLCVPAQIEVREGNTTITCEPGALTWIRFRTSRVNTPYGFAVTLDDGTILKVSISDKVSFAGLPGGQLRVYAFSYLGLVLAEEGKNIFDDDLASICSALSSNYIEVLNIVPEGGTVQTVNGLTQKNICTSDELADIVFMKTSEVNEPIYDYLITDENNQLLNISPDGAVDVTDAPPGVCRIWGIAYTGGLIAKAGDDILNTELAEGCYDISDNYVTVIRSEPEGATIAANGGTEAVAACDFPEGSEEVITLSNTNEQTFSYSYLLSNEAETTFTIVEGNTIKLTDLPPGNSRVRGISYAGQLAGSEGIYPEFTNAQTGCFDLSDNFITLTRIYVEGGQVALTDGSTTVRPCGIDDLPDTFSFQTTSTAQESYAWILSGEDGTIKRIYTENEITINEFEGEDNFRVSGLSYRGEILPVAGQPLENTVLVDGCFQLSENAVTITRIRPEGGTVALADGSTSFTGCDSPDIAGQTIIDLVNTGDNDFSYAYLLTDINNNILQIITEEAIPLSNLPEGSSRLWGLNYEGALAAQIGENPTITPPVDGCSDLSDNFIAIERIVVDGGELSLLSGGTEALTCGSDNIPDAFTFSSTTIATDQPYVLVVTDVNDRVFSTANGGIIDFDLFAPRTYRIWGLSYTGTLDVPFGSILTEITPADGCFDLSNNFVTVRQEEVNGGDLQFAGGGTEQFTCPGDGNPDVLNYLNNGFTSDSYLYLITNSDDIILSTTETASFDFDSAPSGNCKIWGLAYSGQLNAPEGENIDTLLFSDECYSLSNNFLSVIREVPTAGEVSLLDGSITAFTCPGDGQADVLTFSTTSSYPGQYLFLITGEDNRLMDISFNGNYDFDFAEPGNCRVWGVAFTGNLMIEEGDLITEEMLSDDCWEITSGFVSVVRQTPTAGTLAFTDGSDLKYTCPGDGNADLLEFSTTSTYPGSYLYLITNENNEILTTTTEPNFDFDEADLGTCHVWGLAYTGSPTLEGGVNILEANALADDCFELSENFLSVVRDSPEAGTLSTPGGDFLTLCVGDALADVVQLNVEGASNSQYAYLITDESGFLIGTLNDSEFNFNNAEGGICLIYGLAYTGEITIFPGDNIQDVTLTSDCYNVSDNFITLNRISVDGSTIFTGSGATDIEYICSGDGLPDPITFQNGNNDPQTSYQYLITSASNSIIGEVNGNTIDVEGSPFDTLRIWGVAYLGTPTLPVGMDITTTMLSDSCYDISDNFVTLINDLPEGGRVTTLNDKENIRVCIGGSSGLVSFTNTSTALSGYTYLVTTPDLAIVGTAEDNTIDFNDFEVGNYLVHGLSYTGNLTFAVGDTVSTTILASSCFELSDNAVQVERTPPLNGGTITSAFGDPLYVCLDDGMPDIGAFETSSEDAGYRYVITDTLNNITIPNIEGNVVDFDQADVGFSRVYGVSFTGNFIAVFGSNILEDPLSDRCAAVSTNYVSLVNDIFDGGTVSTEDGATTVDLVVGDGTPDLVVFDSSGTSGINYTYIITDENNAILSIPSGDSQDFEGADEGICRVWGLAYSGELLATAGDTANVDVLTTGCFELSDNFITVNRLSEGTPFIAPNEETFNIITSQFKVQLYPNPVSTMLSVSLKALFEEVGVNEALTIEVFDLAGRPMISQVKNLQEGELTYELNVQDLPIGMYVLRVSSPNSSTHQSFFKQ